MKSTMDRMRRLAAFAGLCAVLGLQGCASLVSNAASGFADDLGAAVANQTDPETVRAGAPSYMLLLDSLVEGSPDDPAILSAAANLYASYGAVFAEDPERARRLTARAEAYGYRAMCASYRRACDWPQMSFRDFEASLDGLRSRHADSVYAYGLATLAYIRAHSDDMDALAHLPHAEALLKRYLELDGDASDDASVYVYLGILATLRPPALGGDPEQGRAAFEKAIELSGGRDLSAKLEYARGYARLMYERELHDRLLREVLAADPNVPGYTLTNILAQEDAAELLASADDYF
jgi:TRAP transporter T-component